VQQLANGELRERSVMSRISRPAKEPTSTTGLVEPGRMLMSIYITSPEQHKACERICKHNCVMLLSLMKLLMLVMVRKINRICDAEAHI
jgi:hypothetical protein